ncbi:MAG: CinA family protein [Nitrospirae bacterium]|nr:CinA family protein [Nitrospirota bacterium]
MKQGFFKAAEEVHRLFRSKGLTLSAAESCTGGLISNSITSLPGASTFFRAGVIAYSIEAKENILGVSPETIKTHGVISRETAVEMAQKMRLLTKSDYSVSTTGNLGPEVFEEKERGLIYIAVSKEGKTISRELRLKGDRASNKEEAALESLKLLIEVLE